MVVVGIKVPNGTILITQSIKMIPALDATWFMQCVFHFHLNTLVLRCYSLDSDTQLRLGSRRESQCDLQIRTWSVLNGQKRVRFYATIKAGASLPDLSLLKVVGGQLK